MAPTDIYDMSLLRTERLLLTLSFFSTDTTDIKKGNQNDRAN